MLFSHQRDTKSTLDQDSGQGHLDLALADQTIEDFEEEIELYKTYGGD